MVGSRICWVQTGNSWVVAMNYYNEFDRKAASWLRCLINEGLIPKGEVDERDIKEVRPSDLYGYSQCHFFAGIGGWSYALRLAKWPGDKEVWTGSCPCGPFSVAGKRRATDDPRHLWPAFRWLIAQCRPATIFGEQVASKSGRAWLNGVQADLETLGYRSGAADLCAAGLGAPHIRQRLWWVADSDCSGLQGWNSEELHERAGQCVIGESGTPGRLADTDHNDNDQDRGGHKEENCIPGEHREGELLPRESCGAGSSFWGDAVWWPCKDGKYRRIATEPSLFPVADGLPGRVGLLRGAGNAIVPQVAQAFIEAFIENKGGI